MCWGWYSLLGWAGAGGPGGSLARQPNRPQQQRIVLTRRPPCGAVISAQSLDLGFTTAGTLAELNVQIGDTVQAGQVLARLADTPALELAVQTQELARLTAQQALVDLQSGGALVMAQAQANLAEAQTRLVNAQANLHQTGDGRCADSKTREYYFEYASAQKVVDEWEGYLADPDTGYGRSYLLEKLTPMRKARDEAIINLNWCQTYTDQEINNSQAELDIAQAQVALYTRQAGDAQVNQGIDPQELAIAQASVVSAEARLAKTQAHLADAALLAPIDGTVMAVDASAGQSIDSSVLITLSNLEHLMVQVTIDETDLINFAVGCGALVSFDSLPNQTFAGVVSAVAPSLVTVQSVGMVQGLIDLQTGKTTSGKVLPPGLVASVEITCQQAKEALLVPLMALYEPGDGQAPYVYILTSQGQPQQRPVEVGLQTVASAEIVSGLEEGEKVIISRGDLP